MKTMMKTLTTTGAIALGIFNEMLMLDIVITSMVVIFMFSVSYFCFQCYALHTLRNQLSNEEIDIYESDDACNLDEKIEEIIIQKKWLKYADIC